ncbi:MAG TPA: chloride channel protein [Thermoanaerobaculia bacterium]|nr:chloride channel protein [Thermoanaerobaculia bacterium]
MARTLSPWRAFRFSRVLWRDPDTQFFLLAVTAGAAGALGAIAFRFVVQWLTRLLFGSDDIVAGAESLPAWLRVAIPAAGGLVAGLIVRFLVRDTGPEGVSHMIEVVSIGRRSVRLPPSLGRAAASIVSIATGGSVGREGMIIQMGAALASSLSRAVKLSPERVRILTACGMAAGVAGAYNTPIAATLFVLEVVIGSFSMALFGPAVVSAVVSTVVVRSVLGDEPVYHVARFALASPAEFAPLAVIGLLAGASAALFSKTLRLARRLFAASGLPLPVAMAVGGAAVGALGIGLPEVLGNGFEGTNRILAGGLGVLALGLLFAGKTVATAATVGSGAPGGVFTPSLMVGAALGGLVAHGTQGAAPWLEAPVGAYALIGMGGLLAGITRAPLLAVIMIFELTQNTAVLLPMMAVSVLAVLAARTLERDSMYVESLRSAGIVWEKTPEATAASSLKVADIMRRDVRLLSDALPLADVLDTFLNTRSLTLYIGDAEGRLRGAVDIHDVKEMLAERDLATVVTAADLVSEVPCVTPEEPLTSVNEKLWFRDLGQLPVVDSAGARRFLGVVTRRDLLGAFDREILQRDRLVARFRATGASGRVDYFDLPEKHRLAEVEVPPEMAGRTMAESDLRARFGVSVLAVKRLAKGGVERRFVPAPEDRLERGDVLIVLATDEAIALLKAGHA